ncbi:chaplin [Streptomyces sp. NPDC002889]|uniref:chaplin n=1 Tax=Streptomyces sp. NPDC002889 TaxID=3364669 RepID=UPI003689CF82
MFRLIKSAGVALAVGVAVIGGASCASADAGAEGVAANSPGVLSGNVVQAPVHAPVNACGNSLNTIGMLNPSAGNVCVNGESTDSASAGSWAQGVAVNSPGVLSGNVIQVPVHAPVNACGNSLNIIGMLNPSAGNVCVNS